MPVATELSHLIFTSITNVDVLCGPERWTFSLSILPFVWTIYCEYWPLLASHFSTWIEQKAKLILRVEFVWYMQTAVMWVIKIVAVVEWQTEKNSIASSAELDLSQISWLEFHWSFFLYNMLQWKCFPHFWAFMRGFHQWLVDSIHKG